MKKNPNAKASNASVIARLRSEEKACREEAANRAKRARRFIAKKWFFLAVTELIEAEVAHHEAEAVKRARKTMSWA